MLWKRVSLTQFLEHTPLAQCLPPNLFEPCFQLIPTAVNWSGKQMLARTQQRHFSGFIYRLPCPAVALNKGTERESTGFPPCSAVALNKWFEREEGRPNYHGAGTLPKTTVTQAPTWVNHPPKCFFRGYPKKATRSGRPLKRVSFSKTCNPPNGSKPVRTSSSMAGAQALDEAGGFSIGRRPSGWRHIGRAGCS